jgi:hypothetical protein
MALQTVGIMTTKDGNKMNFGFKMVFIQISDRKQDIRVLYRRDSQIQEERLNRGTSPIYTN